MLRRIEGSPRQRVAPPARLPHPAGALALVTTVAPEVTLPAFRAAPFDPVQPHRSRFLKTNSRRPRVLVHDFSGHPFQVQLSRELARRGFPTWHLYCADVVGARGNLTLTKEDPPWLHIEGVSIGGPMERYRFVRRFLHERRYGRRLIDAVDAIQPDVVICSNTPLDTLFLFKPWCDRARVPFVFWLQDVLGLAANTVLSRRLGPPGRLVGAWHMLRERALLRGSDHVVPISDDFLDVLHRWGVPRERITVIENWAPLDEMPAEARDNPWARQHDLVGRPVALYSGALGLKHNPGLLLELAKRLEEEGQGARLVVISEGYGADWLTEQQRQLALDCLVLLPFQPFDRLPQVLASGDVVLAMLEPGAGAFCVPSKVLSYMCVGRPVVLAADAGNLASKLVERHGTGRVVGPDDAQGFARAVTALLRDGAERARMGARARSFAERTFDIRRIGDRFQRIIERVGGTLKETA